jgi:DNA-binding NarL/FixJ family response regulator
MNMVDMQTKGRDTKRSGDTHPRAKLTAEKVVFAKQLRQMGFTNQAIGANFGVSESAIRQALSGRAWKQVFQEEAA